MRQCLGIGLLSILILSSCDRDAWKQYAADPYSDTEEEPETSAITPSKKTDTYWLYSDIRYAEKRAELTADDPSSDRLLDIYAPVKATKPEKGFPVVLFVHGGGFNSGDKARNGLDGICSAILAQGYAIVPVNYYLYLKYNKGTRAYSADMRQAVKVAADDEMLALDWLLENESKYGLDMDRLALYGGSAGAMTCLEVAYIRKPGKPAVKAVLDLWGSLDDPARIAAPAPPMLIIHGDADETVNIRNGYALKENMEKAGLWVKMIVMKGKGHAQYGYVASTYMNEINDFLATYLKTNNN